MAANANRDLQLERGPLIPASELRWDFGPASGPGGQHVNRANTRVGLTFSIWRSAALTDDQKTRMEKRLAGRTRHGAVRLVADDHRSQWRNRQVARQRLRGLLDDALAPDPPPRRASKPGPGARRRRMEQKRRRSETKRLRRPPDPEA